LKSLSIDKLPNLSDIHFNLGITYQNLEQKQNALKHVQKALQLASQDQNKFQIYQNYYIRLQQI
jgi:tetratricopeptide (TPR) repeat protein